MKHAGIRDGRTIRRNGPDFKQRFVAALSLAGLTREQWASSHEVTVSHLNHVLDGRRVSAKLRVLMDAFVEKHLGKAA